MSVPRRQQKLVISRGAPPRLAYGWRRRTYWTDTLERERRAAADRERWLRLGRALQADTDCKRLTFSAGSMRAGQNFRVVDAHGRSTGQRFTALGHHQEPAAAYCALEAQARDGGVVYLGGNTRVRICNMQTEDMHSRFSRMLKAAHRRGA